MPHQARLRLVLRWMHIGVAAFLGAYVYSPFHADPVWTDLARYGVLPLVGMSGVAMWQQARVNRWSKRRRLGVA